MLTGGCTCVKYNPNYFHLYPLFGNSSTGQTRRRTFTQYGSNDVDSRKDVPFLGFVHMVPYLRVKLPQKPQFWGVNRRFQAKLEKWRNVHIIKTASILTKFCTVIGPIQHDKSKMTDVRNLGKIKIVISWPRFERNLAR